MSPHVQRGYAIGVRTATEQVPCETCDGTGEIIDEADCEGVDVCPDCDGGWVPA